MGWGMVCGGGGGWGGGGGGGGGGVRGDVELDVGVHSYFSRDDSVLRECNVRVK